MSQTHPIEAFGEVRSISSWSKDERCVVTYATLYARLVQLDWQPELAITTPTRPVTPYIHRTERA